MDGTCLENYLLFGDEKVLCEAPKQHIGAIYGQFSYALYERLEYPWHFGAAGRLLDQ